MDITLATYNIGDGPAEVEYKALTRLVEAGAELIAIQEGSDREELLSVWCDDNRWQYWVPDVPGAKAVPILTAPDVKVRRSYARIAVPERYVGAGAGPDKAKTKAVNLVRIQGGLVVMNTHFTPSATRLGWRYRHRRKHYRMQAAVLGSMVRVRKGASVVCVGDFNAPPNFRLLRPLRLTGIHQVVEGVTHGNRLIDHVWVLRCRGKHLKTLDMPQADHNAPVVKVNWA